MNIYLYITYNWFIGKKQEQANSTFKIQTRGYIANVFLSDLRRLFLYSGSTYSYRSYVQNTFDSVVVLEGERMLSENDGTVLHYSRETIRELLSTNLFPWKLLER